MTRQQPDAVPLTIVSAQTSPQWPSIAIGTNVLSPNQSSSGQYWFVVLDRNSLEVLVNVLSADPDAVPAAVQPYAGNPKFMLIVVTSSVSLNNVPQGPLYDLLVASGAGSALSRLEQINEQLSCGGFGRMSYAMAGVLGGGQTLTAVEALSLSQVDSLGAVLTAQLIATVVNGQIFYTPIEVQG